MKNKAKEMYLKAHTPTPAPRTLQEILRRIEIRALNRYHYIMCPIGSKAIETQLRDYGFKVIITEPYWEISWGHYYHSKHLDNPRSTK
jgi:hypothetical protein